MGLIRFVQIACVIWLLFIIIKKLRHVNQDRPQYAVIQKQMVQCVTCSVYVAKDDALKDNVVGKNDQYICSNCHMETNE